MPNYDLVKISIDFEQIEAQHLVPNALRVALKSIDHEIKTLAWDANMHEKFNASYARARYAYKRTQALKRSKDILQALINAL